MKSRILLPGQIPQRYHRLNRVDVVPFECRSVQYKTRQVKELVPVQKKRIEFQKRIKKSKVPVQRTVMDYLPIKKEIEYEPRLVRVKSWDYLPIQKTQNRVQYVQIQKTVVKGSQRRFQQNRYCRLGPLFRQKYFNDNPQYDLNALSTYDRTYLETVQNNNERAESFNRKQTNEYQQLQNSYIDKNDKSTIGSKSGFNSQFFRTKRSYTNAFYEYDSPLETQ